MQSAFLTVATSRIPSILQSSKGFFVPAGLGRRPGVGWRWNLRRSTRTCALAYNGHVFCSMVSSSSRHSKNPHDVVCSTPHEVTTCTIYPTISSGTFIVCWDRCVLHSLHSCSYTVTLAYIIHNDTADRTIHTKAMRLKQIIVWMPFTDRPDKKDTT